MIETLGQVRLTDIVDILVVTVFLWTLIGWLRRTRARLAVLGLSILTAIYLGARFLDLQLTAWILQGFFAVFVVVVVVVFQEEIRRFFERIGMWGLRRPSSSPPPDFVDLLVRAVARFAEEKTGALLIFRGKEPLERHVQGGIPLDARISEPLLFSLLDPHSPGHDGAVLLSGDRMERFAVHLPLSRNLGQIGTAGTRHAAALGITERCDALAVVVSEERGVVSVAKHGEIRQLERPSELTGEIREYLREQLPEGGDGGRIPWRGISIGWREAIVSFALAVALWMVAVPGSAVIQVTRSAEIVPENIPSGYQIDRIEPDRAEVTLSGRRRDLYLRPAGKLRVSLDVFLIQLGRRTFQLTPSQVSGERGASVVDVAPAEVVVTVQSAEENGREP